MVTVTTGVMGSGKTYRVMYILYANFGKNKTIVKDKSLILDNVKSALVLINEVKLDRFDNVTSLNWDNFYSNLCQLHSQYLEKVNDSDLIELAKELNMYDLFIVIDEFQNYFDRQDKVLIWWISYHRHLHHEIELITQNLSLVHHKYKNFPEFYYKAIPSSRKLFKNSMKYHKYTSSRMTLKDKFGTDKVPVIQEVFDSYGSGKNQKQKSILHKFLILAFFLIIMFFIILKFSFSSVSKNDTKSITNNDDSQSQNNIPNSNNLQKNIPSSNTNNFNTNDLDNQKFITLFCSTQTKNCYYNNKSFNITTYLALKSIYNFNELSLSQINSNMYKLDLLVSENFYNLFNYGGKNEKDKNNNGSFFTSFNNNNKSK